MPQDEKPLVVVVDDEDSVCRALVRLLRSEGYCAQGFASAAEFLDSVVTCRPACLVLDVQMPHMSGLQLQERLVALDVSLPVIIITAHDEAGMRNRCLAMGARFYFRKPIEVDSLLVAVREVVGDGVTELSVT